MKKILVYFGLIFMTQIAFSNTIIIENKTNYPEKNKDEAIAVQWAVSANATENANRGILNAEGVNSNFFMLLTQKGKNQLALPNEARYFRIIVWFNNKQEPVLLTNWVDVVPEKTYVVNQNQLVHRVLMSGAGC